MVSSRASSTSSSRSTVVVGRTRSPSPDDALSLTVEALNRLNLARPSTPDEPVHDWTLATREENTSYASSIVEGYVLDPLAFTRASQRDKLTAYRSLIVQFELLPTDELPASICKCVELLRTVHINILDYLAAVRARRPISSVKRYVNKKALRSAMIAEKRFVKLSVAKQEMLRPFLISV